MKTQRLKPIPEKKIKAVENIVNQFKTARTVLLASIKNLPASQLQEMKKQFRKDVLIIIPKKSAVIRAIDKTGKGSLLPLKQHIHEDVAILFSSIEPFELSAMLSERKIRTRAKAGQEAPEEIVVEAGTTDLLPGPAMSKFGALGIKIAIEAGKIVIKEDKVLVKKGGKISMQAADMMGKLDMKLMMIGLEPFAAYDSQEEKIYTSIAINKTATIEELRNLFIKSLAFAVSVEYIVPETLPHLIKKAGIQEKTLDKLLTNTNEMQSSNNQETRTEETS